MLACFRERLRKTKIHAGSCTKTDRDGACTCCQCALVSTAHVRSRPVPFCRLDKVVANPRGRRAPHTPEEGG